jgi:methionine-R-sulfoxide reductase
LTLRNPLFAKKKRCWSGQSAQPDRDPMHGTRITSEQKSTLRTYIGMIFAVSLAVFVVYFFFLTQKQQKEMKGFDPNRPIPTDEVLKSRLTPEQYFVVRQNGSETPFQNKYWDNTRTGLYVDIIDGQPLFASTDKYDNGLGIPAFTKPISKDLLVEKPDNSEGMQRTEVRSKRSNAHLGYVFPDPKAPNRLCYSIYSAALRFVPVEDLKVEDYESYASFLGKE